MHQKQQLRIVSTQSLKVFIILFLFLTPYIGFSQESCTQKLESAEELYEKGQINKVVPLLQKCLQTGFSKAEKVRAYKLLTLCHLYYNENQKAAEAMGNLLKVKPEYEITEFDPTEFSNLHETFRTRPLFILGIKAGGGSMDIYDITNYNDLNSLESEGVYTPGLSYSFGVSGETPIIDAVSLVYEAYYHQTGYKYEDLILNYASIEFEEQLTSIEMPLLAQWNILKNDFCPYINAGVSLNFLIAANGTFVRRDRVGDIYREPLTIDLDLLQSRNTFNYGFTAGAGFRWKNFLGRGYLTFDLRYTRYFENLVDSESRADYSEMVYSYFTTDNPLKTQNFQVLIGYKLPIYFARQKRKFK
ncbi:MAG: hypothetical protein C0599_12880 [Salinivirgaceae bacterium]|nr:MAG: hypothetical protein C0599_12880 [Salinivirgaceae bacterium]